MFSFEVKVFFQKWEITYFIILNFFLHFFSYFILFSRQVTFSYFYHYDSYSLNELIFLQIHLFIWSGLFKRQVFIRKSIINYCYLQNCLSCTYSTILEKSCLQYLGWFLWLLVSFHICLLWIQFFISLH